MIIDHKDYQTSQRYFNRSLMAVQHALSKDRDCPGGKDRLLKKVDRVGFE